MIVACRPRRSGITLTEILIAILIMGVGLISLATLFPLGLLRLRLGTQLGRAGLTFQTAADDMDSRGLLFKPPFRQTWYGLRDPFVQDAYPNGSYYTGTLGVDAVGSGVIAAGNFALPANNIDFGNPGGPSPDGYNLNPLTTGLPICYDPLWRSVTGIMPNYVQTNKNTLLADPTLDCQTSYANGFDEARFGSGIFGGTTPYIQADPGDKKNASAHGLQRLTNFIPWSNVNLTPQYNFTCHNFLSTLPAQPADVAGDVFTSVDDIVFNPPGGEVKVYDPVTKAIIGNASSVLPDLSSGAAQADYRFTWFFTGRQVDANGNGAQFNGEIVVCDGRPFGFDPLPGSTTAFAPAGETVVEAVYGYGGNSRAVLLRWSNTLADPQIRVGGWIADTTYERVVPTYRSRVGNTGNPFARCSWYQIAKRVDPTPDPNIANARSMVVTLTSPVRTITAQNASFQPVHANVALIMPSVINVFPRTFEVH